MAKSMLIVHEFGVIRKLVTHYAMTDLGEIKVATEADPQVALARLGREHFDVVLCGMEMTGLDGIEFKDRLRRIPGREKTPVIILTSTDTPAQRERLAEHDVEHFLIMPFNPVDLRFQVERVLDLPARRSHARYSIPCTVARFDWGELSTRANVINLSHGGMLCEFELLPPGVRINQPVRVGVEFPAELGQLPAEGILTALVRLSVSSWTDRHFPSFVTAAWKFVEVPPAAHAVFTAVLGQADRELSQAERAIRQRGVPEQ